MDDLKSIETEAAIKSLSMGGIKEIHIRKDSKYGKEISEYLDYQLIGRDSTSIQVDNLEKLPYEWAKVYGVEIKIWNE